MGTDETLDEVATRTIELIAKHRKLAPDRVTLDSTFADLGIDSLDAMDLLFQFEDAFGIEIPNDIAQQMRNVRQVVEALRAGLAQKSLGPA
jgi:acyl carrier protein